MANPKLGQEDQIGPHKKDGSFSLQLERDSPSGLCSATAGTRSRSELTEKTQENPHLQMLRTTLVPGACVLLYRFRLNPLLLETDTDENVRRL